MSTQENTTDEAQGGKRSVTHAHVATWRWPALSSGWKPRGDKDPAPHRANGQVAVRMAEFGSGDPNRRHQHEDRDPPRRAGWRYLVGPRKSGGVPRAGAEALLSLASPVALYRGAASGTFL